MGRTDRSAVEKAVLRAIASLNETLSDGEQIPLDSTAPLARLDSLAITNLLVALEQSVQDTFHTEISMTDEQTLDLILSEERTPLRNVGTLVDYVSGLLDEARS